MNTEPVHKWRRIAGWVAVVVSTAFTCFWAFWGIIENFHEGWHYESMWANVGLMFVQYLSIMLGFLVLAAVSIAWPRVGAVLHVGIGAFALWFFSFDPGFKLSIPAVVLAAAYWFGRPQPRKWAFRLLFGATILTLIVSGAEPAWRVLVVGRLNDGDFGARLVEGNGVTLIWAPEGPGWPRTGFEWDEAVERCRHLTEDGLSVADEPQDIWRLPTADEAVRSMHRHGKHCGGVWDGQSPFPHYDVKPDKETPLWNIHSHVIYWWTATGIDDENAYMICYNGQVRPRKKNFAPDYFAFRAVKEASAD